jgi:RimJ/RimL family protein N-acetyltransferase
MHVLETDRLALRRPSPDDVPFICRLLNEPSFLRFIGDKGVRTLDDATPIGICGLLQRESLDAPDLGYAFLPAYWSRGYALEAVSAVLACARGMLGLGRIVAVVDSDNETSIRVLEKLGLGFERMVLLSADDIELRLFGSGG